MVGYVARIDIVYEGFCEGSLYDGCFGIFRYNLKAYVSRANNQP